MRRAEVALPVAVPGTAIEVLASPFVRFARMEAAGGWLAADPRRRLAMRHRVHHVVVCGHSGVRRRRGTGGFKAGHSGGIGCCRNLREPGADEQGSAGRRQGWSALGLRCGGLRCSRLLNRDTEATSGLAGGPGRSLAEEIRSLARKTRAVPGCG